MFVRKFEADTIEEALKDIKRELGPDAVILKTITNKGLKGAFKKKKIEITAAISEKNYVRKAKVDHILDDNQKDSFYNGSASYIANMIDQHDQSQEKQGVQNNKHSNGKKPLGYGMAGLNKQVNMTKGIASHIKEGLDDFLSLGEKDRYVEPGEDFDFDDEISSSRYVEPTPARPTAKAQPSFKQEAVRQEMRQDTRPEPRYETRQETRQEARVEYVEEVKAAPSVSEEAFEKQKNKVEELEKKLYELTKSFERINKKEATGIYQLRTILKSLDINEVFVQQLIKKGMFELTDSDVENADIVFEFALREMMNNVSTALPMYTDAQSKKEPTITVFLSEMSCGQTSMIQKVGAAAKDCVVIKNSADKNARNQETKNSFTEKVFGINVVHTSTIAEMVSECRKALESKRNVFIDYRCSEKEVNETKKFLDGLRRAFSRVEVLITLSAIHTELYNRKVISSYRKISDGLVISHLDACMNFGSLFNITNETKELPFKFFGTGEIVPDDIEAASAERLMAGIFKLS